MEGGKSYVTPGFIAAMVVLGASGLVIIFVVTIFFVWSIWTYYRYLTSTSSGMNEIRDRIREAEQSSATEQGGAAIQSRGVGVPPGFIKTLPLLRYSKNGAHLAAMDVKGHMHECPVCLSEYKDGDRIRLLSNCRHIFHPECISTWLESHTTCPLCRTDVQILKKVTKLSSLEKILTFLKRSGVSGGAQIVDSSARDLYTGQRSATMDIPPSRYSTASGPVAVDPRNSGPVSRELHIVRVSTAPPTPFAPSTVSSSSTPAGRIFSSVWGSYVDVNKPGASSESESSSSSGVGFTQVSVPTSSPVGFTQDSVTTASSEEASSSATGFVTIRLDQSER